MTRSRPPAPRWAVVAAWAVPLCVLPSAAWRASVAFGEGAPSWYLLLLTALSTALALATTGLVHRWGERLPQRPIGLAALAGGALLVAICVYYFANQAFGLVDRGWSPGALEDPVPHEPPGRDVLVYYVPLLAWGPLLLAVAVDHGRRTWWSRGAVEPESPGRGDGRGRTTAEPPSGRDTRW